MKLTILGNNGPYPAPGGACSGYLLESDSGDTKLAIDFGAGTLSNLERHIAPEELSAVVLSHLHYDHMSDLLPLEYALQFHPRRPLDIYLPGTPEPARALLRVPQFDLWPIRDCTIGEMRLTFLQVNHPVETYAVRVECDGRSFVYTGDTNRCDALELFCDDADLLLADAGFAATDYHPDKPHLSAALCGRLARDTGARRLLLTHLNPCYDPATLESEARAFMPDAECCVIGESCEI